MWRPTSSTAGESWARATARAASPDGTPKPNFESSWPVRTNSWVCASTPGVARISTLGRTPSSACRVARRSSSSKLSTTMRPTPAARAARSSSSDLLLPCSTSRSAGTPAASATWSSPPVATSTLHALLVDEASHRQAEERLRRVGHAVPEGRHRLPAARPEVRLVVDEQRRAEPLRQLQQVAAPDAQPPVAIDSVGRRVRASSAPRGDAGRRVTSPRALTPRAGRGRSRGRCGRPRPATGAPASAPAGRPRSRSSRGRSRGTGRPARAPTW